MKIEKKKCLKCNFEYDASEKACPECGSREFKALGEGLVETPAEAAKVGSFFMGFVVGLIPLFGLFLALAFGQRRTKIGGIIGVIVKYILIGLLIWLIVWLVRKYN